MKSIRRPFVLIMLGYLSVQALIYGASWIDGKPSPLNIFNIIAKPRDPS